MNVFKALKFMAVAEAMQGMSKDPSTKVGSVAIDDDYNVLSVGYNGFPRGYRDNMEDMLNRPLKLNLTVHSESNTIAQAARKGISLKGSTILVTSLFPCSNCAGLIVQAGISRVISSDPENERWMENAKISKKIFSEGGVEVIYVRLNGENIWEMDGSKQRDDENMSVWTEKT